MSKARTPPMQATPQPPPPPEPQCLTCQHWRPTRVLEVGAEGECHLAPPAPVYVPHLGVRSVRPATKGSEHCGAWQRRPPQRQQAAA